MSDKNNSKYLLVQALVPLACSVTLLIVCYQISTSAAINFIVSIFTCFALIVWFVFMRKQTQTSTDPLSHNELKQRDNNFWGLIEHVDNGLMIFENDKPTFANGQLCKIFDIPDADVPQFNLYDYLPNQEQNRLQLLLNAAKPDENIEFETWILQGNKAEKFVNLRYSFDSNPTYKYLVVSDLTISKHSEQELRTAKDKAEESKRFKTAFLNNVSHEVRTPLNAIFGFAQLLKDYFPNDETALGYLKIVEKNCQILLRLFDDIIDVSSIESRSVILKNEDVRLNDLLLKIVSKYNVQLTISGTKPVEIIIDEDNNFETMVLLTDRKRLTQIFDKLLSNAVKFTNEGQIVVSNQLYDNNITFIIADTGVGIPDEEKELVFRSFSHGENMYVSLHKGVGLGLNIAKLLVELMGGKLAFTSEEGKGTTFSFTFPVANLKNYSVNGDEVTHYKLIK